MTNHRELKFDTNDYNHIIQYLYKIHKNRWTILQHNHQRAQHTIPITFSAVKIRSQKCLVCDNGATTSQQSRPFRHCLISDRAGSPSAVQTRYSQMALNLGSTEGVAAQSTPWLRAVVACALCGWALSWRRMTFCKYGRLRLTSNCNS